MTKALTLLSTVVHLASGVHESKETITTASGLTYIDHLVGSGEEAVAGYDVEVHYTGWLYENGKCGANYRQLPR